MNEIINQIILGIESGSIYALIALGYTMVYGIIRLINFAHGDFIMVACYMIYTFFFLSKMDLVLAIVLSMLITVLLGILTERIAYRPLRKKKSPSITSLITAIAVSLLLENSFQGIYGGDSKMLSDLIEKKVYHIGEISFDNISIIIIVVTIITMVSLNVFIKKTKSGKAMRAVSENPDAAKLMGINIDKTIVLTFVIGTFLASIASVMYVAKYSNIEPFLGSNFGLYAFIAAVVGGIGSIPGACVGGFIIGLVKILPNIIGINSAFSEIFLFGILIIILLFKPAGLFGKNVREKV